MRNEINLGEKQAHCSEIEPGVVGVGVGGGEFYTPTSQLSATDKQGTC